jgi:hypothetical protein
MLLTGAPLFESPELLAAGQEQSRKERQDYVSQLNEK